MNTLLSTRGSKTPIPSSVQSIIPQSPVLSQSTPNENILDVLAASTARPTFISDDQSREDTIMERLLKNKILVRSRIYSGYTIAYFLAVNLAGDRFLIRLDIPKYKDSFPTIEHLSPDDIHLGTSVHSQTTQIGALECLDYHMCGAAFMCSDSLCIATENDTSTHGDLKEETFVFNGKNIIGGVLGSSAVAYPIVSLSALLDDPDKMNEKISDYTSLLQQRSFVRINNGQTALADAVQKLQKKVNDLQTFAGIVENDMTTKIGEISNEYEQLKSTDPDQLPSDGRERYDMIMRSLAEKKEIQRRALAKLGDVQGLTVTIDNITREIDILMDPTVNEVMQNL